MALIPVEQWLESVQRRLDEIEKMIDGLENLLKIEEYRKKAKIIDRENYRLEIVIIPMPEGELDVKIYCTPKVKLDPKYIFSIYLTEFFPEGSIDYIDPEKSEMFTRRIVFSLKTSPQFFEIDMRRILAKIHKFWTNLMDEEKRKQIEDDISQIFELAKSKDREAKRKLVMLRMRINDILLYE